MCDVNYNLFWFDIEPYTERAEDTYNTTENITEISGPHIGGIIALSFYKLFRVSIPSLPFGGYMYFYCLIYFYCYLDTQFLLACSFY